MFVEVLVNRHEKTFPEWLKVADIHRGKQDFLQGGALAGWRDLHGALIKFDKLWDNAANYKIDSHSNDDNGPNYLLKNSKFDISQVLKTMKRC